jgi:hypothetical protein
MLQTRGQYQQGCIGTQWNKVVISNEHSDFIVIMNIQGNYVEMAKSKGTHLSLR